MKTFVIVSDTHGNVRDINGISNLFSENDYLVFCGDGISDILRYKDMPKCRLVAVHGNCDGGSDETVIKEEGVSILVTHGHLYGVKYSLDKLFLRAKELNVNAVLYGHTHRADITEREGKLFINPGNISKYSANRSYCYLVAHNGKITSTIVNL